MSRPKYEQNLECEQDEDQDLHADPDAFDDGPPYSGDYNANYDDHYGPDDDDRSEFADPGGNSALRRATRSNPRNLPCPTCKRENMLTPKDVARGYQCDICADAEEGCY